MEEIIRLLKENNTMLQSLCRNIIEKDQIQDHKDFINNIIPNIYVKLLTKRK